MNPATLAAWTRAVRRSTLAYYAQPIAAYQGGTLPCLADCGRGVYGGGAYCKHCKPIWGKK